MINNVSLMNFNLYSLFELASQIKDRKEAEDLEVEKPGNEVGESLPSPHALKSFEAKQESTFKKKTEASPSLNFQSQLNLVKRIIKEWNWEEKYAHLTLRNAIIEYVVEQFGSVSHSLRDPYYVFFCQLLDFSAEQLHMIDFSFLSNGARIRLLLSQSSLLDVPLKDLQTIKKSDLPHLVPPLGKALETLSKVLNCYHLNIKKINKQLQEQNCEFQRNVEAVKQQTGQEFANKNKRLTKGAIIHASKVQLPQEEIFKEFQRKSKNFETRIFVRYGALKEYVQKQASSFLLRHDQQHCLQLDLLLQEFQNYLESCHSSFQYLKNLVIVLKQDVNFIENLYPSSPATADDSLEKMLGQFLISRIMDECGGKSLNNSLGINHLAYKNLQKFHEQMDQWSHQLSTFMGAAIGYLNHQYFLLTNTKSTEERRDSSKWISALVDLETVPQSSAVDISIDKALSPIPPSPKNKSRKSNNNCQAAVKVSKRTQTIKKLMAKEREALSEDVLPLQEQRPIPSPSFADVLPLRKNYFTLAQTGEKYSQLWRSSLGEILKSSVMMQLPAFIRQEALQAAKESEQHLMYGYIGFDQLLKAINGQDWTSLGEIVPMLILDWDIQIEQLLKIAYLREIQNLPNYHDLFDTATVLHLLPKLKESTKNFLQEMNMALIWARYPENSRRYYQVRGLKLPLPLVLIELSQTLLTHKLPSLEEMHSLIAHLFQLYRQQINACEDLVTAIHGTSFDKLRTISQKSEDYLAALQEEVLSCLPDSFSAHQVNHLAPSLISEIEALDVFAERINQLLAVQSEKVSSSLSVTLKEGYYHLSRLRQALYLCQGSSHPRYAAWHYRNCLKAQLVFEQLYISRTWMKGLGLVVSHDLAAYHENLGDQGELGRTVHFSFGKSIHYSRSPIVNETAAKKIMSLRTFEKGMHLLPNLEEDGFTVVGGIEETKKNRLHQEILPFFEELIPVLALHVEACRQAFVECLDLID